MPPLASYTPFESLLFFQSLANLDARPASFGPISELLKNNQFVQQDAAFDARRLAPEALEELYGSVVNNEKLGSGEAGTPRDRRDAAGTADQPSSPKKRKLSPVQDSTSHGFMISELVSRLYAKYKECATAEIKQEEKRYGELQDQLCKLEAERRVPSSTGTAQVTAIPGPSHISTGTGRAPGSQSAVNTGVPFTSTPAAEVPPPSSNATQSLPHIQPSPSTGSYSAPIQAHKPPERSPATGNAPSISPSVPQASTVTGGQAQTTLPPANVPNAPQYHPKYPIPQNAQTVKFQPPWTPKTAPQSSHIPSPHVPQSNQQIPNQHSQQPLALNNIPYNETSQPPLVPIAPKILPQPKVDIPTQPYVENRTPVYSNPELSSQPQTPSSLPSFAKSLTQRPVRPSLDISRIQTPWKTPPPIVTSNRPSSPIRPRPEDISPISERSFSPVHELHFPQAGRGHGRPEAEGFNNETGLNRPPAASTRSRNVTPRLSKRDARPTPSPSRGRSRGRSSVSHMGDSTLRKVKQEMPSTPIGITHDGEMVTAKRKRTPSGIIPEDIPGSSQARDQYIICTRTFPRTCAPVMNDIAAHKHASIFAKPLTNRDAPGYRDLIYRPQDIKSIKSAIHQGSKAVAAASEALNTPNGDPDSSATGPGIPTKNGGLMLKKSAEIVPPKAIVNSSQLEKELIRMFANAIMFNPTPERTFGSAFPMKGDSTPREEIQPSEVEEGGIIKDTLEMFEDVEQAVSTWRAAERTVDDVGNKNS